MFNSVMSRMCIPREYISNIRYLTLPVTLEPLFIHCLLIFQAYMKLYFANIYVHTCTGWSERRHFPKITIHVFSIIVSNLLFNNQLDSHNPRSNNKISISWGSPGECSMIDHFLRDASVVLFCPFWSTVLQCGTWLPIHTLNYWTVQSVVPGS